MCLICWRPHGDSNPGLRREWAPSWASRRWGPGARALSSGSDSHDQERRPIRPASVPEIHELQRLLELEGADARHDGLQVIALLAGDAELIALDRGLHLELAVLDGLHELAGEF